MSDPSLEAFLRPLRDAPWLEPRGSTGYMIGMSEAELRWRARDLVRRTEARIAEWLRKEAGALAAINDPGDPLPNFVVRNWHTLADAIERGECRETADEF